MTFLEETDLGDAPTIPEYYKGKIIFITGGSGFMGQTLIEKLLYSCSELDRIYLLMRPKKGVKSEDRLAELYSSHCFERLKIERPGVFESKVFVVAGDVCELELGLSASDRVLLINKVNIIFHVAASVRFNDALPEAIKMNLRGTREIVELAKEIRNLSVMVHVSTAYSNSNHMYVEEKMYPPLADWRETIDICDNMDRYSLEVVTNKYICNMPNTYVFSKQLAEHVVYEQKGKLPVIIIRPSIVIHSLKEPFPGWMNNFNGPVGLAVAVGKGIMRSAFCSVGLNADFIPVDCSISHFIAASWIRGIKKLEPTDDVAIYNCSSKDLLPFSNKECVTYTLAAIRENPSEAMLWYPRVTTTNSSLHQYINVLIFQLLPAIFIDFILWLLGKKTMLVKIQRRIFQGDIAMRHYIKNEWTFDNTNFLLLRSRIKKQDKKQFFYKIEGLDKQKFVNNGVIAGKKVLLGEKPENLPKARANLKRFLIMDYAVKLVLVGYIFWKIFQFCCS